MTIFLIYFEMIVVLRCLLEVRKMNFADAALLLENAMTRLIADNEMPGRSKGYAKRMLQNAIDHCWIESFEEDG